ncbi:MAG: sulfite reductase (NADPH) flavoprotein alpha-component [Pseudoalteromonas tetraodonis]|jgi:sulfite reductase (NADPH) flavoprotein alpha-component
MSAETTKPVFNRKNPLIAKLKKAEMLTKPGSGKDTRHYEIDLCGSGLTFEPGDSLAVLPTNCPEVVDDLLTVLGFSGEEVVPLPDKTEGPIREALINSYAITTPDKKFMTAATEKAGAAGAELGALLDKEKKAELSDFLWGREIIDIVEMYPEVKWEPAEFVGLMKKLNVRLYSIASSLRANPDQVHLTVATVTWDSHGRKRKGVCTTFLAERCEAGTAIPCFITPGKGFRLPAPDEETPIIMCGPGTGIAPFRSFLQERAATDAKGKTWLFFGDQTRENDYLYEEEFEAAAKNGQLDRLDLAFSRDQEHKIYVQHRMLENAEEFWKWLEEGAIFYVCGDALRMANDVDKALHEIVEKAGGKSPEEAIEYVAQMKKDKRYRRDVY